MNCATLGADRLNLVVNDIKNLVSGNIVSRQADETDAGGRRALQQSADHQYRSCCGVVAWRWPSPEGR